VEVVAEAAVAASVDLEAAAVAAVAPAAVGKRYPRLKDIKKGRHVPTLFRARKVG